MSPVVGTPVGKVTLVTVVGVRETARVRFTFHLCARVRTEWRRSQPCCRLSLSRALTEARRRKCRANLCMTHKCTRAWVWV